MGKWYGKGNPESRIRSAFLEGDRREPRENLVDLEPVRGLGRGSAVAFFAEALRDEVDAVVGDDAAHLRGELAGREGRMLSDSHPRERPQEVAVEIDGRRLLEARDELPQAVLPAAGEEGV